jgi:hypothetical protein
MTCESLCEWFSHESTQASSNYGIGTDGRVALIVDEANRAWTSSSSENDNRAITIECASDKSSPYAFNNNVYNSLINLCVDICKRNGKTSLLWIPDKSKALNYQVKNNEMLLTVHRWFSSTDCPGEWLMARLGNLAATVTGILGGTASASPGQTPPAGTTAQESFIASIAPACVECMKKTGILASVSIAQACLESAWGSSELAKNAHNLFGMKASLSGNTWPGSTWGGKTYAKQTTEYADDVRYEVKAMFRAYNNVQESINDHAAYLAGAMDGKKNRYPGICTLTNPGAVCDILIRGGYATDPAYKKKLIDIIEKYGLKKYDSIPEPASSSVVTDTPPFDVKVEIDNLNLRTAAGTDSDVAGTINPGKYTITKTKKKNGMTWGKIKPVSGWICLDYTETI